MEIKQLEHELISTYDYKKIKENLIKINANPLSMGVWNINSQWELPIPLQSVLKSVPKGDFE